MSITVSSGNYSYEDIRGKIQPKLRLISIALTLFNVLITLRKAYQLDLRDGGFSKLIGFNKS